jgi:hypothetical protein
MTHAAAPENPDIPLEILKGKLADEDFYYAAYAIADNRKSGGMFGALADYYHPHIGNNFRYLRRHTPFDASENGDVDPRTGISIEHMLRDSAYTDGRFSTGTPFVVFSHQQAYVDVAGGEPQLAPSTGDQQYFAWLHFHRPRAVLGLAMLHPHPQGEPHTEGPQALHMALLKAGPRFNPDIINAGLHFVTDTEERLTLARRAGFLMTQVHYLRGGQLQHAERLRALYPE